jgi:hypothetical protein
MIGDRRSCPSLKTMSDEREEREVVEVEVERLPDERDRASSSGRAGSDGPPFPILPRPTMGPILAGVILDGVDLLTQGPWGVPLGLLVGGSVGYYLARRQGFSGSTCLGLGFLAGLYCALPFTARLPLATLVGVYSRFVR